MPLLPRHITSPSIIFALLVPAAAVMAGGYVLDLAGLPMHPVVLVVIALAAMAGVLSLDRQTEQDASVRWERAVVAGVTVVATAHFLWLASPSLLPVTDGPDVVHHLQLLHLIQRTWRLPHDPALLPYLVEMFHYTPGSHIFTAAVAGVLRMDALRVVLPVAAGFAGVKAGILSALVYRLARGRMPAAAVAAPVLALVPAVYTVGSFFRFFFFAQVVSETFAMGAVLALVCWTRTLERRYLAICAGCGVGVVLSWPVWIVPVGATMVFALLLARRRWFDRAGDALIAFGPIAIVAGAHLALHAQGGSILATSGAVTAPSVAAFGIGFLVCAAAGVAWALRHREGAIVLVMLVATIATSLVLAALGIRNGSHALYLPFKMVYLAVQPAAVLGAVALGAIAGGLSARVPRARMAMALLPVAIAAFLATGRVPLRPQRSPINEPAYAAGVWARAHVPPACVDYFSRHWLTGYWLHLDVLGNPRESDRMRAETFEFRDSVGKWIEGHGLPFGIIEDLDSIPRELRPELTTLYRAGSMVVVRNAHPSPCQ